MAPKRSEAGVAAKSCLTGRRRCERLKDELLAPRRRLVQRAVDVDGVVSIDLSLTKRFRVQSTAGGVSGGATKSIPDWNEETRCRVSHLTDRRQQGAASFGDGIMVRGRSSRTAVFVFDDVAQADAKSAAPRHPCAVAALTAWRHRPALAVLCSRSPQWRFSPSRPWYWWSSPHGSRAV